MREKHQNPLQAFAMLKPTTVLKRPLFSTTVRCGFPSPADDYIEDKLDLNELIIKHPAATFFVRASGHSMKNAGIFDGDLLIVDRSITPEHNHIVIAAIDGELTVKRLKIEHKRAYLAPENNTFKKIPLKKENNVHFWGVVTYVIHALQ